MIINCIGPETYTYKSMVKTIKSALGVRCMIISMPVSLGIYSGKLVGQLMGDVTITQEEIEGLMRGLLFVNSEPAGHTKFSEWLKGNADWLGRKYANELARRKNRIRDYSDLAGRQG